MTKDKSTGVDSFSSDESKARSIVLMLILRKRLAHKLYMKYVSSLEDAPIVDYLGGQYTEANNAAELARRILYKEE